MGIDLKWTNKWTIALPLTLLTALGVVTVYRLEKEKQPTTDSSAVSAPPTVRLTKVAALGTLEPKGEVIQVSTSQRFARIEALLVAEGDQVEAGEVVAILDSVGVRQAAVKTAQQEVAVARSRLAKIKAGAQRGEINAQKAKIERLKAELAGEKATQAATLERLQAQFRNAKAEFERYQFLEAQGAISESELEQRLLDFETAREAYQEALTRRDQTLSTLEKEITEAQATLEKIEEVRPVDIQEAQAQLQRAIASLEQAKADLELSKIKAPMPGKVIAIFTYPGEIVSETNGILELGNTQEMIAVAEVYESDISRVELGQSATIISESNAFAKNLKGEVTKIGLKIGKKDVLGSDPAAEVDARVVKVEVTLTPEASQEVQGLTNAQVLVKINTDPQT
ncbi:MAG: HlyD family efflux transporter periplasmic adaptor subunit [Cyanobacteria bacterium]|jgi:HlyD family secretion protein|nr:HlyD family efflux transporter periplasmic adaptor subunit [Cyanobacteria bacterium GSL.Bin21]